MLACIHVLWLVTIQNSHCLHHTLNLLMITLQNVYITSISRWTLVTHCVKSVRIRSYFWSVFSRIQAEYGEIRSISRYSVRMRENTDQKNSEYGRFSRSGLFFSKNTDPKTDWTKTYSEPCETSNNYFRKKLYLRYLTGFWIRFYWTKLQITEFQRIHQYFIVPIIYNFSRQ